MRSVFRVLAMRRWAGVGLALVVELAVVAVLALASPADVIGIPAAVAASIAVTVAVVYGIVDGAAVAFAGALVFAALGGWEPGGLSALALWPAIVGPTALFARRVERHRQMLRQLVGAQERERRSLALTLHDERAQELVAALLTLRAGGDGEARERITETIQALRELAVELSPRSLDDHGLDAAVARLVQALGERAGIEARFDGTCRRRLPAEVERAFFRFAQAAVGEAIERDAHAVEVEVVDDGHRVRLVVVERGPATVDVPRPPEPASEHLRLLGGRVTAEQAADGTVLSAELAAPAGLVWPGSPLPA